MAWPTWTRPVVVRCRPEEFKVEAVEVEKDQITHDLAKRADDLERELEELRKYAVPQLVLGVPRSPTWPKVRAEFLKTHPACAACGGREVLEVHHIKPYHLFPALELDPDNLLTLCDRPGRNCHFVFGHLWSWSDCNENVREDSARFRAKLPPDGRK